MLQLGEKFRGLTRRITAPQLFVGSFGALVLLGSVGFKVLPGLYVGAELSWLDALFTATSAVCVTGLIVVDTATYFTAAGQAYILLLIQLGGLGILTFTSVILLALGMRLSLRHESVTRTAADLAPHVSFQTLARDIILFTVVFEALGAAVLFVLWLPNFGVGEAAWHAVFHAVSAFCNAGFSTFSNSLMPFQRQGALLTVVMILIVAGGLGFLALEELRMKGRRRGERLRMSLHTRLVLLTTTILLAGGWMLFATFEWHVSLEGLPVIDKLSNSLFMSVTARTAGFNTVGYSHVTDGSNFLTILLMSIGGSPGSMAGGLKTTTVAVIGLLALSRMRGYSVTSIWGRSIPKETVERATGLFVVAFGIVTGAIFAFTVSEIAWMPHARIDASFLKYMFEAVSAFNTVGLSMGTTGDLSGSGKILTIILMYLGRVGPLTFAAALARRYANTSNRFHYAYEEVAIG